MSNTANWSYANVATVYPFTGYDGENNVNTYGEPYLIACTWKDEAKNLVDNEGIEFISISSFYTEDNRPKRGDFIGKGDLTAQVDPMAVKACKIKAVKEFDMSFFNEKPDYEVIT